MAALTIARITRPFRSSYIELAGKNETVFHGGLACFDTATGFVAKAFVATTLHPIGTYEYPTEQSHTTSGNGLVRIKLFREISAVWMVNDATNPVVTANIGGLCYALDDQTVGNTDLTNTVSVAGKVWKIDAVKGVLVEPVMFSNPHLTGLDG